VQNLGKAINALGANLVLGLGTGLAGPLISGVGALGAAAQGVIDAVRGGNLLGTLDAVVTGPAVIADGVLNGGFGPNLASLEGIDPSELIALSGGLLNQGALLSLAPLTILAPGTIASLQFVQQQIATAIDPPPAKRAPVLNSPGAVPNLAANTVAVNTPTTKPGQRLAKIVGGLENAVGTTTAAATGVAGSGKTTAGNSTKPGAGLAKIATGLAKALTGGSKPSVGNGAKAGGPLGKIASALNAGPRHKRAAAN
jgi:hypothetical protein